LNSLPPRGVETRITPPASVSGEAPKARKRLRPGLPLLSNTRANWSLLERREEVVGEYVNGGKCSVLPPVTLILKSEYVVVAASKVKVPVALPPSSKKAGTGISVQVNGTADAELAKDNMPMVAAVLTMKAATAFAFRGLPLSDEHVREEHAMIFLRRLWKIPPLIISLCQPDSRVNIFLDKRLLMPP